MQCSFTENHVLIPQGNNVEDTMVMNKTKYIKHLERNHTERREPILLWQGTHYNKCKYVGQISSYIVCIKSIYVNKCLNMIGRGAGSGQ